MGKSRKLSVEIDSSLVEEINFMFRSVMIETLREEHSKEVLRDPQVESRMIRAGLDFDKKLKLMLERLVEGYMRDVSQVAENRAKEIEKEKRREARDREIRKRQKDDPGSAICRLYSLPTPHHLLLANIEREDSS